MYPHMYIYKLPRSHIIHGIGDFSVRLRKLKYNVKILPPSPPPTLTSNQLIIGCVDQSTLGASTRHWVPAGNQSWSLLQPVDSG